MKQLRIAAIVDDPGALTIGPLRVMETLCTDERFALVGLLSPNGPARAKPSLSRLAMALDARLFSPSRDYDAPAFSAARGALPILSVNAINELYDLDVLLDFTEAGVPEVTATAARFGLWRLTAFDAHAGFFETMSAPVGDVDLIRITDDGNSRRLIASAAYNVKVSAARTAAFMREKSAQLLIRELKRLALEGAPADHGEHRRLSARRPGAAALAAYGVQVAGSLTSRALEYAETKMGLRPGMFFLKYGKGGPLDFDPASALEFAPTGNRYWADPFLLDHQGERFVFFEDYDYASGKGHIGVGKITDGVFAPIGPALVTDYHLSFPFLFHHDGALYMLPETNQTERLEIWRCVDFPGTWTLDATALNGTPAADSVIMQHGGEWWLFTNLTNDSYGDHCSELHLFRADGPMLQNLTPHPLNPVVINARTARGGGRIFASEGRLYRFSQDNSHGTYGYGLNIMEITRLGALAYEERLVRKIEPNFEKGLTGCHHGDFAGDSVIIDVRRKRGGRAGS